MKLHITELEGNFCMKKTVSLILVSLFTICTVTFSYDAVAEASSNNPISQLLDRWIDGIVHPNKKKDTKKSQENNTTKINANKTISSDEIYVYNSSYDKNTNTVIKSYTCDVNGDKYFIDYGSTAKNNLLIKKNNKVIYNAAPISGEIHKVDCLAIRGKIFWRISSDFMRSVNREAVLLGEDTDTGLLKSYFDPKNYYSPSNTKFFDLITARERYGIPDNSSTNTGNCLIAEYSYRPENRFSQINHVYRYILDYDNNKGKFIYTEPQFNPEIDDYIAKAHSMIGKPDKPLHIRKHIKETEKYSVAYPEINTGNISVDNAINNDLCNAANEIIEMANNHPQIYYANMEYTIVSETDKYISVIILHKVFAGGNHEGGKEIGVVYSKINGQRIPLSNFADVSLNYLQSRARNGGLINPYGLKHPAYKLLSLPARIPDSYCINKNGQLIVMFQNYELVAYASGRPGIDITGIMKSNVDYVGNTQLATSHAESGYEYTFWSGMVRPY